MAITLHYHPLSSYCHKVLIALYKNETPFKTVVVNLGDPVSRDAFRKLWPIGKMPVLVDDAAGMILAESSIIIEYLDRRHPGATRFLPDDPEAALQIRFWDRFFDLYLHMQMQKVVGDSLRPAGARDVFGVEQATAQIRQAYAMIDKEMRAKPWVAGEAFTLADCSAAPALFYADTAVPIGPEHGATLAYLERLKARPAYARTLSEAKPFFHFFPLEQKPRIVR